MSVGKRIKDRRKQLGYTAEQVGEMIGKNRATIYRYESDEIENMPYDVIEPLAKALNVSPIYLMGWEDNYENEVVETSYPYYDTSISAGLPADVEGTKETLLTLPDELLGKWAGHKDIYLTRINGESMNKVIPNGSMIVVKQTSLDNLKNNDIVVFSHNNEYSVKRIILLPEQNKIVFKPDSHDISFIDYVVDLENQKNLIIHGKVVTYIVELLA